MNTGSVLKLAFVGDICLGMNWLQGNEQRNPDYPYAKIRHLLEGVDLAVGNLECCLVDETCSIASRTNRMAVPATFCAEGLRDAGFSVVNLANNHILDCGSESLEVTLSTLDKFSLLYFGAGRNSTEANRIVFAERHGYRMAFLGVGEASYYYAYGNRPGIASLYDKELAGRIQEATQSADLVIVSVHADIEFNPVPAPWRRRFSRWLVKQGAHLVIQHHPHVLQGIEEYKGGLIAYSLGNFIFRVHGNPYQSQHIGVFDSLILRIDVNFIEGNPQFLWHVVPLRIAHDNRPKCLENEKKEQALVRFKEISSWLSSFSKVRRIWHKRCRQEAVSQIFDLYYMLRRQGLRAVLNRLFRLIETPEHRNWVRGLLTFGFW